MRTSFIALFGILLGGFLLLNFVFRTEQVDKRPLILGHGGAGVRSIYPLNSIQSIQSAFELNAEGVEIDVKMSLDGELFAYNGSSSDEDYCASLFESLKSNDIEQCRTESWIRSSPIKTLKETIQSAVPSGKLVSLDLKTEESPSKDRIEQFANAISELFNEQTQFKFLIESENKLLLERIQQLNPETRLFLNLNENNLKIDPRTIQFDGVVIHVKDLTTQTLIELNKSDLELMVWGVGNVFDNRKALRLNASVVQTDDLHSMNQILE